MMNPNAFKYVGLEEIPEIKRQESKPDYKCPRCDSRRLLQTSWEDHYNSDEFLCRECLCKFEWFIDRGRVLHPCQQIS